jgi:hypothetical protein
LLPAIWVGVGFIFRGVATTVSAISDPTLPGRARSIFVGVISLVIRHPQRIEETPQSDLDGLEGSGR